MKICNKCGKSLPLDNFIRNAKSLDGHEGICKDCKAAYMRKYRKKHPQYNKTQREYQRQYKKNLGDIRLYVLDVLTRKRRAVVDGKLKYTVELTTDELVEIASNTPTCPICGKPINYSRGRGMAYDDSPSLDRKDNGTVINKDNSWVICYKCNRSKSDRTVEELVAWCKLVVQNLTS
jgi:5-methylcytosine-specific restriction endonuclease McrA